MEAVKTRHTQSKPDMFNSYLKSYVTLALRSLFKHKLITFLNLLGLAVALACTMVVFIFIEYEQDLQVILFK